MADDDAVTFREEVNDAVTTLREEVKREVVASRDMCEHCFDALLHELSSSRSTHGTTHGNKGNKRKMSFLRPNNRKIPAVDCPLFVTWKKLGRTRPATMPCDEKNDAPKVYEDSDYELRGCIGTLAPRPLDSALAEFALTSAFHDVRFDPIALIEVPRLKLAVSLLVGFSPCRDCLDWVPGLHGIIIKFHGDSTKRSFSATYLPEVAVEQGWSQREAVLSLVRKAGYYGTVTEDLLSRIHCTRYQSSKRSMTYQEYELVKGEELPYVVEEVIRKRNSESCINL